MTPLLQRFIRRQLSICLLVFIAVQSDLYAADKIMIVILDGARYSETFGDPMRSYIPNMNALSDSGTIVDTFLNDSLTYTAGAIPALWCGSWTEVRDTLYAGVQTKYARKPTIFEYYRRQLDQPAEQCVYVLKYLPSLWLQSFTTEYGPEYWPYYHSEGRNDRDVATQTKWVMDTYHPKFLWIYLADVDGAGHSADWNRYLATIQRADSIVGVLWDALQADPFYKDATNLFVTNDHGRHDDAHGGFSGHGNGCDGCRHIQFLAVGPDIKMNFVSTKPRRIPDLTVTAGQLLGFTPERSSGEVMTEIFKPDRVDTRDKSNPSFILKQNYPNPFNPETQIGFRLSGPAQVRIDIYDISGKHIQTIVNARQTAGEHTFRWNGSDAFGRTVSSGVYVYRLQADDFIRQKKMLLIK